MTSLATLDPSATILPSPIQIQHGIERVVIILIKATQYNRDCYPNQFLRVLLPPNTLAAVYSLTVQALEQIVPSRVETEIHVLEEAIWRHSQNLKRLYKRFQSGEEKTKLIVCFVGVQTAQFPRACDLIKRWQDIGATCVIGGFHVSGSITAMLDGIDSTTFCPHIMPSKIQSLMDNGVIVFHGEAENVWREVLTDILRNRYKTLYRGGQPENLWEAPLPRFPEGYFQRSYIARSTTFESGRGCPYRCSFCTITTVQGHKSRCRDPQAIADKIKSFCERVGKAWVFITDDDFARSLIWEAVLDSLIALREQGYHISIMVEADLACGNIPRFLDKLARAGCKSIFFGVETMNQSALQATAKGQNKVSGYRKLFDECHKLGMRVHAGYIIGFPNDTPQSVRADVEELYTLGVDEASFFMLMPLPGSADHMEMVEGGVAMDPDHNKYDSTYPVIPHPLMSAKEWNDAYLLAWRQFYTVPHMIETLKRCKDRVSRLSLLKSFVWCRLAFAIEGMHPMSGGAYRIRNYQDRRPGSEPLAYWRFCAQEVRRHLRYVGLGFSQLYQFQQVVFATECAPAIAAGGQKLTGQLRGVADWLGRTFGKAMTREWLNAFWVKYGQNRWRLLYHPSGWIWHLRMLPHALTEIVFSLRYMLLLRRMAKA